MGISVIEELKKRIEGYDIKPITEENYMEVMGVYESNQEYSKLSEGREVEPEDCLSCIREIPPGFDLSSKFFVGLWENNKAAAVLDFLIGYPNKENVWIGLLMIHGDMQGKSLGRKIASAVFEATENMGFSSVQLGVLDNNIKALSFWEGLGYKRIRERKTVREDGFDWNVIIMEKQIK